MVNFSGITTMAVWQASDTVMMPGLIFQSSKSTNFKPKNSQSNSPQGLAQKVGFLVVIGPPVVAVPVELLKLKLQLHKVLPKRIKSRKILHIFAAE